MIVNMGFAQPLIFNSAYIPTTATAEQFKDAIAPYYTDNFDSTITVTREGYDITGSPTDVAANVFRYDYNVIVNKRISMRSWDAIHPTFDSSNALV